MAAAFFAGGVALSILDPKTLGPVHVEYSLLHYFNFFWLGIVLAYFRAPLADWIAPRSAAFATALGWLGLALCISLSGTTDPQATSEALRLPGVYLGLAAVFVSTFAPRSGFRAFCARPWISLVGGACYSIYLVHLQVTQVVASFAAKAAPGAPLAAVAAIFVASALVVVAVGLTYYVLVERRFMTRDWHLLVWAAIKSARSASVPPPRRRSGSNWRFRSRAAGRAPAAPSRRRAAPAPDGADRPASRGPRQRFRRRFQRRAFAPRRRGEAVEAAAHQEQMAPVAGVDLHALEDLRQQRRPQSDDLRLQTASGETPAPSRSRASRRRRRGTRDRRASRTRRRR